MQHTARESYLVTEVLTATPQKLQLMLIEAAIRSAQRARRLWQAHDDEQACEALIRAQEIVSEMISGLDREAHPELVGKVAAVYLFIFRSLVEASTEHDEKKLGDALRVLEIERGTWREVCEKVGGAGQASDALAISGENVHKAAAASPPPPHLPPQRQPVYEWNAPGLSLEA